MLNCIRFTCPRCYSEGQEDRLAGHRDDPQLDRSTCEGRPEKKLSVPLTRRLNSQQRGAFLGLLANDTGHFLNTALCDSSSPVWPGSLRCLRVLGSPRTHTRLSVTQQVLMKSLSSGASKAPAAPTATFYPRAHFMGQEEKKEIPPFKMGKCAQARPFRWTRALQASIRVLPNTSETRGKVTLLRDD